MAPWTHMHFMPNKDVNPCCLSPIDQTIGNMENQTIHEVWNSPEMQELRKNMLEGKSCDNFCHRCYDKEENGFTSLRTHMNERYAEKHWDIVESTQQDGTVEELNLIHWDFRFSNICNQKCRTCGIEFSTQWHDDYIKMWELTSENAPPKVKKIWKTVDAFEQDFETLFDKVEYIHFAGGEPLITDEHYRVLERLIAAGKTDVRIRYSTNFNTLKYKKYDLVDMWSHFNQIELMASIDDIEDRYNYMRKGGDWNTVVDNFNRLKDAGLFEKGNIEFGLHPTISFWNVYYLPEFHKKAIELGMCKPERKNHFNWDFHINTLIHPEYYNVQMLPAHLKEQVTEKLNTYANELEQTYPNLNTGPFRSIVSYMNSEDKTDQLKKMKRMTRKLDMIRSERTASIFPFIAELFE
jgi:organic radical activating enzyme